MSVVTRCRHCGHLIEPATRPITKGVPVVVAGRTLTDIAAAVQATPSFLSRLHLGRRQAGLKMWGDIAEYLGLSLPETFALFRRDQYGRLRNGRQALPRADRPDAA